MSDHHHTDLNSQLTEMIRSELATAITNPVLMSTITSMIAEQMGFNTLQIAERTRPIRPAEAVVEFKEYNIQGDTLMLIPRRLRFHEQCANIIISFEQDPNDPNNVTFSAIVYSDHPTDCASTKFIEVTGPALDELNRQIAELYKPDMMGKSLQLTLVIYPAYFAPKDHKD